MKSYTGASRMHAPACAIAAICCLAITTGAQGQIRGPYSTVDGNTMHLWHLDELATPAVDQAHYAYTGTFTTKADSNQPLTALFGTSPSNLATLGNSSFSGFGNSLSTAAVTGPPAFPANSIQPGLGALTPNNGTADNVDHTFDNPTTHAFTMEAIIKFTLNPTDVWAAPQEIIAGEGDAGDSSDRSWQFRLEQHANSGDPWLLRFQKVSGFGGVGGSTANYNLDGTIPTTGVNALVQNGFYHVAVTYNGDLNDAASLKLYWTKLDASNTQANQINSGNMNGWLREQDTDLSLGNELRDFNGNTEPYNGLIDEVRISDIARAPTAFIFGPILTPGDVNGDHVVNTTDFDIIRGNFFKTGQSLAQGDLTGDGIVNFADFRDWKNHYAGAGGGGLDSSGIPEPASIVLFAIGAALVFPARRLWRMCS